MRARMGMEEKVLYSSFNHYTLLEIKKKNPGKRTGMLFEDGNRGRTLLMGNVWGVDALHPIYAHLQHPGFLGTVQGGEAASACVDREYKRTLPADGESRRGCCDSPIFRIYHTGNCVAKSVLEGEMNSHNFVKKYLFSENLLFFPQKEYGIISI